MDVHALPVRSVCPIERSATCNQTGRLLSIGEQYALHDIHCLIAQVACGVFVDVKGGDNYGYPHKLWVCVCHSVCQSHIAGNRRLVVRTSEWVPLRPVHQEGPEDCADQPMQQLHPQPEREVEGERWRERTHSQQNEGGGWGQLECTIFMQVAGGRVARRQLRDIHSKLTQ